jgi:hypothetical protein
MFTTACKELCLGSHHFCPQPHTSICISLEYCCIYSGTTNFSSLHNVVSSGIAQPVWRRTMGWKVRVRFPVMQDFFLFSTTFRPVLGPTQPPLQLVPGALSPEEKRLRRGADHSPPFSAEVKKVGAISPLTHVFKE